MLSRMKNLLKLARISTFSHFWIIRWWGRRHEHQQGGDAKLVPLCLAWQNWGLAQTSELSTVILHCRTDVVIPFADSEELVMNSGVPF